MLRIGKKVGVLVHDYGTSKNKLEIGVIIARKSWWSGSDFVVRTDDGRVESYRDKDLWTKFKKQDD